MLLVTLSIITIIILKDNKQEIQLDNVSLKASVNDSFALMLEQTDGTYAETTDTEWPSEGYSFNKHMSGCIDSNGNTIKNTLTYKNGTIKLKTKHNTYCYIYFDIDRPATEELIATVPEEQLWDSTLEDDGYRYVGTNPDNYICFGTDNQEECMNDTDKYMYRIIGIFEDGEGKQHLKLIKKEALNTSYAWHSDSTVDIAWDESDLYKGLNGSYFATNREYSYMQDSAWNNLITTWNYTSTNTKTYEYYKENNIYLSDYHHLMNVEEIYYHEMNRSSKTSSVGDWNLVSGKISLMYVNDYALSLGELALSFSIYEKKDILKTGWMHISKSNISAHEWGMTYYGFNYNSYNAWCLLDYGYFDAYEIVGKYLVRPVFYLEADTKLDKGTGTSTDPYTIEISPNLREYCEEYNNINECIENEENNIEEVSDLWNSTLEDDGIRYVGTNPNNYVCFGTTNKEECTGDTDKYMYRIIGIFEDGEGKQHLKLIKKLALNSPYAWHKNEADIDWDESDLYKGINGSYFLTNSEYSYMQDSKWKDKIIIWDYIAVNTKSYDNYKTNSVYGPHYYHTSSKSVYLHEMNRSSKLYQICYWDQNTLSDCSTGEWKTINAKIGLIYVSDFMLSLGRESLEYRNNETIYRNKMSNVWLNIKNNDEFCCEWTMSQLGGSEDGCYRAYFIYSYEDTGSYASTLPISNYYNYQRPVFYLTENIKITSGKGSITEPFILS